MRIVKIRKGGGLENLSYEEMDTPKPKDTEVLIKWRATSLNFHDYLVAIGGIPVMDGRVPMSDGAGEVIEIGKEVNEFKVGDKVMSLFFPAWNEGSPHWRKIAMVSGETVDGYMCDYSCLDQNFITHMPNEYSYTDAATLPCAGLTAWNGLMNTGGLQVGESVLIEGTGGMSLLGLQIAKATGAEIYATTSSDEKADKLLKLGVKQVFNYKEDPKWGKAVFRATGGVDHILDVGGGSTMVQSIEAVRIGGYITSIGILGDGRKGQITFPKLFFKFVNLRGIAVGSREMQRDMVKAIEVNNIKPIVDDKVFAFSELKAAFEYQNSGQQFGKIVIDYDN